MKASKINFINIASHFFNAEMTVMKANEIGTTPILRYFHWNLVGSQARRQPILLNAVAADLFSNPFRKIINFYRNELVSAICIPTDCTMFASKHLKSAFGFTVGK